MPYKTTAVQNKALVLEAFDTLFNKRDYKAAERYWSSNYIQHSAHIAPGRDGLFNLVRSTPATLKYEPGLIVAENDYVIIHGRFSGMGRPRNWIAADVVRVADGVLAEHWDVLQDEATKAESRSGLPMFGTTFPEGEKPVAKQLVQSAQREGSEPQSNAQWQHGMSAVGMARGAHHDPAARHWRKKRCGRITDGSGHRWFLLTGSCASARPADGHRVAVLRDCGCR